MINIFLIILSIYNWISKDKKKSLYQYNYFLVGSKYNILSIYDKSENGVYEKIYS